jgi:hypothetical protein
MEIVLLGNYLLDLVKKEFLFDSRYFMLLSTMIKLIGQNKMSLQDVHLQEGQMKR